MLSSSKEIFDKNKKQYQEALINSGYGTEIEFQQPSTNQNQPQKRKNRKRTITWYNPPYDKRVKTNIGHQMLNLIKKHFPLGHKFHPIFNKNTIKVSYSCMKSVGKIISSNNGKKNTNEDNNRVEKTCNCDKDAACPFNKNCLEAEIVYKATIETDIGQKIYYGLTSNTFKRRWYAHNQSFLKKEKMKDTEISKYVWAQKDKNRNFTIKWELYEKSRAYRAGNTYCKLCIDEKTAIIYADQKTILNNQTEFISTCRHRGKHLLTSQKDENPNNASQKSTKNIKSTKRKILNPIVAKQNCTINVQRLNIPKLIENQLPNIKLSPNSRPKTDNMADSVIHPRKLGKITHDKNTTILRKSTRIRQKSQRYDEKDWVIRGEK